MDLFDADELVSTLLYGQPHTRHGLAVGIAERGDAEAARALAETARLGEGLLRARSLEVVGLVVGLAERDIADLVFSVLFPVERSQVTTSRI